MQNVMFRIGGVGLGLGAGLGWGWISGRLFTRPVVQDVSAVFLAALLGCATVVAAEIARLLLSAGGGLGAVSAGVSEFVVLGVPIMTIALAVISYVLRQRFASATHFPIVLGGISALVSSLWVVSTIRSSFS